MRKIHLLWLGIGAGALVLAGTIIVLRSGENGEPGIDGAVVSALSKAAETGDFQAQYELGVRYHRGDGVVADASIAARWFAAAAAQGHIRARTMLGTLYENGAGVKRDFFKAADLYRLAARRGNDADAQYALGNLHYNGRGVAHDYDEAFHWFELAANQGHAAAQFLIGVMLEEGWGREPDYVMAYIWYSRAIPNARQAKAANPGYDPEKARRALAKRMRRHQIERAEKELAALRARR
ncbi:MAG: tetratricopeptide repeat protein [Rhodospirillales bacterium]|nr:tetratricopeptide repeat protein [Rhodospirillales bacterium]